MKASIGVSAGPVRVSQGLPGLGAVIAGSMTLLVLGAVLVPLVWLGGLFATERVEEMRDGSYSATVSSPEHSRIKAGTYETTTPPEVSYVDVPPCLWKITDSQDHVLRFGNPGRKEHLVLTINHGERFYTDTCGTWVRVS